MSNGAFSFRFDETPITLPNGERWFASGRLSIEYTLQGLDRSVGIFHSFVDDYEATDERIALALMDADGEREAVMIVSGHDALIDQITDANAEQIREECFEADRAAYEEACDHGYRGRYRHGG